MNIIKFDMQHLVLQPVPNIIEIHRVASGDETSESAGVHTYHPHQAFFSCLFVFGATAPSGPGPHLRGF